MSLREINKGQRILLFVFLPIVLIIVSIGACIIFETEENNQDNSNNLINTNIPQTFAKTDEDINKAYQNAHEKDKRKRKSDFNIGEYITVEKEVEPIIELTENIEKKEAEKENKTIRKRSTTKKENIRSKNPLQTINNNNLNSEDSAIVAPTLKNEKIKFNSITVGENVTSKEKNKTSKAFVHANQTMYQGAILKIRTGEEIELKNGKKIPKNTFIYGICEIVKERLQIQISQIQLGKEIITCNLMIHDTDGNEGIHIPGSAQKNENKHSTSKGIKKIGSVINSGTKVAGGGILGDVAEAATEGIIDAVSNGAAKNVNQVKVNLNNNYVLYIKEK